jgi:hypothetical protein
MKNIMTCLQLSPLYPPAESGQALKGRMAVNNSQANLVIIAPLRGMGVN